jgi:hypothetical protein
MLEELDSHRNDNYTFAWMNSINGSERERGGEDLLMTMKA